MINPSHAPSLLEKNFSASHAPSLLENFSAFGSSPAIFDRRERSIQCKALNHGTLRAKHRAAKYHFTNAEQRWKVRLKNNLSDRQLEELSQKNMMSTLKDRDQNKQVNGKVTSEEIKVTKAGRRNFQNITKTIRDKIKNTASMKKKTECYF